MRRERELLNADRPPVPPDDTSRHLERELHKLAVARSDVAAAGDAAQFLRDTGMGPQFRGYWALADAAVIAYTRPFKHNQPYGPIPRKFGRFKGEASRRTHRDLLEVRDELVAHSPARQREVYVVPAGSLLRPGGEALEDTTVMVRDAHLHPKRWARVVDLCALQQRRLSADIDLLLDRLYGEQSLPERPFQLEFSE